MGWDPLDDDEGEVFADDVQDAARKRVIDELTELAKDLDRMGFNVSAQVLWRRVKAIRA